MRRLGVAFIAALTAFAMSGGQATVAASTTPSSGDEATQLDSASQWFMSQREAPNDAVNGDAFAAALSSPLPVTSGSWTEQTTGNYFTDSPTYAPVGQNCGANCFQNSGSGERYVAGRMTALAVAPNGTVFAGGADGGLWRSTNQGANWTAVGDALHTLSIGSLLTQPAATRTGYNVFAGTGEANGSGDSYAGVGVYESTNGGNAWTLMPSQAVDTTGAPTVSLNGSNSFRLLANGGFLYDASSHGLYRIRPGLDSTWTRILSFDTQFANGTTLAPNLRVWDMISDVIALGSGHILAVAGWRAGEPTNGLYESTDGGTTFTFLANPNGWVPASQQGRVTLAADAAGDRIYAIVQNANAFVHPDASGSILAGIYETTKGAGGPWSQIASPDKLSASDSAESRAQMRGYKPGVQAWYNQFLAVDPANPDHLYAGLEEVYETQNAGTNWETIGPYWNLTLPCFSYTPFEGTCNHQETHSDQHAAFIDANNGLLYIGNDGGVWSKSISDHSVGNWNDLNTNLDTLQYYGAAGTNDGNFYGGMQDNGSSRTFPSTTTVLGDTGTQVTAKSVQVFGGDGGYTIVDPNNVNNVITEYVDLISARSNDGGRNWVGNGPADPDPRFIAPIVLDHTVPVDTAGNGHVVAGGAYVWDSTKGFNTNTADWQKIYDLTQGGTFPSRTTTAIGTATVGGVTTTWVAWCGPCNPSFSTGGGFHSGLVELSNAGGAGYQVVSSVTTGGTSGLPNRYISGVFVDPSKPSNAYASFSGYSRHWIVGPDDPGTGHAFQLNGSATTITGTSMDGSGSTALIDAPADDVIVANNDLIVGTDFGVYVSKMGSGTWSRLGGNLPNAVVGQLGVYGGNVMVALHGRGLWTFPVSSLP